MSKVAILLFCAQALMIQIYAGCLRSNGLQAANAGAISSDLNVNLGGAVPRCGNVAAGLPKNAVLASRSINIAGLNTGANCAGLTNGLACNNVAANNAAIAANSVVVESGYGGSGTGDLVLLGDLGVFGNTLVNGNLPVYGLASFNGFLPASGLVSVCGCTPAIC